MTDLWTAGTAYALGAVVARRSAASVVQEDLTNANFEAGDTGWTKGANWAIGVGSSYQGTQRAILGNGAGITELINANAPPGVPGQSLTFTTLSSSSGAGVGAWASAGAPQAP